MNRSRFPMQVIKIWMGKFLPIGLVTICLLFMVSCQTVEEDSKDLYLIGGKIYPGPDVEPIENGVIAIKDSMIVQIGKNGEVPVPENAKTIDCSGKVITAGFWNSHVHFTEMKWQGADTIPAERLSKQFTEMFSQYGFTHVFDISNFDMQHSCIPALQKSISDGRVLGPTIMAVGAAIAPPEGSPYYIAPHKLFEAESAEVAIAHVKFQFNTGANGIKMWSASPNGKTIVQMPTDIGLAITGTAHHTGKQVFAHPTNNEGVETAIACNVDILAHVSPDGRKPWDNLIISTMIDKNMAVIPTLKLYKWELKRSGQYTEDNSLMTTAIQQLQDFHNAGGEVLFGTDVGYVTDYSTLDEYRFMHEAGLSFNDILRSLTTAPAKRFGNDMDNGKLEGGAMADIVILNEDPVSNIENLLQVHATIRKGKFIYQEREGI